MMPRQWWIEIKVRLNSLFRRPKLYARADEELEFHLAMRTRRMIESGMAPDDAKMQARREFGNSTLLAEQTLDSWRYAFMDRLAQDVSYAVRMLLRMPAFLFIAVLSLSLGIGANTLIFSLINTTLLRPLPFRDPDSLVTISIVPQQRPDQRNNPNVSAYLAWKERSQSFESMGSFFGIGRTIGAEQNGTPAETIGGQFFTPSLFETLGVKPALGRIFTEEE